MQTEKTSFQSGINSGNLEIITVKKNLSLCSFLRKKKEKEKTLALNVSSRGYTFGHWGVFFHWARLVSPDTLFLQTMWKGLWGLQCDTDNVIRTEVNSCSPSISISIIEPSCCIVGSLACNASAVYSAYWGAAWQFQLSRDALEGIST